MLLDSTIQSVTRRTLFCSLSQLCSTIALTTTEQYLHTRKDNVSTPKFNGKLDIVVDTSQTITEINKTAFEDTLRGMINHIGLQPFFYVPNSTKIEMILLVDHTHKLTLDNVINQYTLSGIENNPPPKRVF